VFITTFSLKERLALNIFFTDEICPANKFQKGELSNSEPQRRFASLEVACFHQPLDVLVWCSFCRQIRPNGVV
jgi:hypothetical protein